MSGHWEWLKDAERELKRSRERLESGDWEYTCYHAQQCAELALKAYLVKFGNFLREHSLVKLYERCRVYGLTLTATRREPVELSKHYSAARYRNARRRLRVVYSREVAEACLKLAARILEEVKTQIG